jgi:hypothetical protein
MLQSEQINELAAALAKAQGVMGNAVMNRINPHFKSKYADMGSVLDAIRPPLSANGLCIVQPMQITERGLVLRTVLMHSSGQYIAAEYPLPATQNAQALGSALTYARRYSLATLVCNASDEDDDANDAVEVLHSRKSDAEIQAERRELMEHDRRLPNVAYTEASQASAPDVVLSTLDEMSERDSGRAAYLEECREKILAYENGDVAVLKWWASDEQHRARRAFALTQGEVDYLKNLVSSRLPKKSA